MELELAISADLWLLNVSASSLSIKQSAHLTAMIPNPRFYDRKRNTPWLLKKTEIIINRMPSAQIP